MHASPPSWFAPLAAGSAACTRVSPACLPIDRQTCECERGLEPDLGAIPASLAIRGCECEAQPDGVLHVACMGK